MKWRVVVVPNWGEVTREIEQKSHPVDDIRTKDLRILSEYTGRNVIAYYSGFMQFPAARQISIEDEDKNAFMQMVYGMDRSKGLDLILHTPGGDIAATESLVYYLRQMFGTNIRAFIPQMAMSAGTMIALSCKEIIMGKQSNLGPIDPQYGGISCAGVLKEFSTALEDVRKNPSSAAVWASIIGKYHPTFLGDCENAIRWSKTIVTEWLASNMLLRVKNKEEKAKKIVDALSDHDGTFAHNRHIHMDELKRLGVKVIPLESFEKHKIESCKDLQDCLLTLHHAYMQTIGTCGILKILESQNGNSMRISIPIRERE